MTTEMPDEETALRVARERPTTARHEAGHAVAAVHYGCPIENVSIEGQWPALGTTRLGVSRAIDAIVIFCGPLAERSWNEFQPGADMKFETVGSDQEILLYLIQNLPLTSDECSVLVQEAITFLSKPAVQAQIDAVTEALLAQGKLTTDELRGIVGI
jgi:hypothetical protein